MLAVYHVPDGLPDSVVQKFKSEGVSPGDRLIIETGRRPRVLHDVAHRVIPLLSYCRLLGADPGEAPASETPRLQVIQGGA